MSIFAAQDVRFRYTPLREALQGISLRVNGPELIAIAGPNGSGKSTLLDLLAGLKTPNSGTCALLDRDARTYTREEYCRLVAHVPQQMPGEIRFSVRDVVLTGRTPHGRGLYDSDEDRQIAEDSLQRAGLLELADREFSTLSGGEKQRVLVAAAVCQQTQVMLLDEPGAHLDPKNEGWLWALMRELRDAGQVVVIVTHHLTLAAMHADRVWLLRDGRLDADGPPSDVLRPERLRAVYEIPFHRLQDENGRVFLTYGE